MSAEHDNGGSPTGDHQETPQVEHLNIKVSDDDNLDEVFLKIEHLNIKGVGRRQ